MAGKFGSASALLLVDGYNLISAKLQGLRYKIESLTEPSHGLGDSWEEHTPVGVSRAEVSQEGAFFDTSSGNMHSALSTTMPATPQDAVRIVCLGFAGNTSGEQFLGFEGAYSQSYEVLGQVGKLQRANADYAVTGIAEPGVIVHPLGIETGATNTAAASVDYTGEPQRVIPITSNTASTAVKTVTTTVEHGLATSGTVLISGTSGNAPSINGEALILSVPSVTSFTISTTAVGTSGTGGSLVRGRTVGGGSAYLQVTSLTLDVAASALVTIRDSTDNSTFSDLVAFVATTGRSAQRVAVTGVVERYVAESIAFSATSGSPSITYFAGFSRI